MCGAPFDAKQPCSIPIEAIAMPKHNRPSFCTGPIPKGTIGWWLTSPIPEWKMDWYSWFLRFLNEFERIAHECFQRVVAGNVTGVAHETVDDTTFDDENDSPAGTIDPWVSRPIY